MKKMTCSGFWAIGAIFGELLVFGFQCLVQGFILVGAILILICIGLVTFAINNDIKGK